MSEHPTNFPEFYLTSPQTCPYLPNREERKLFTHLTHEKPPEVIDGLLRGGFRRSQNIAYMPYCDGCHACLSVRVVVDRFQPSRGFRRILGANSDLVASRVAARPTAEQYGLFREYIDKRHSDGGMAEMTVLDFAMMIEDSVIDTFVTEYRLPSPASANRGGTLVGVTLCDRLSDGLSMVYSFYDPDFEPKRSLGTYMILEHIDYARRMGLGYLYLGYWIESSPKMSYKNRFQPLEILTSEGWTAAASVVTLKPIQAK